MIGTVIIAAIVALLVSSVGTLMALKIQHRYLQRTHIQHKAWEQAQEGYQRNWEMKQEKRALSIEAKLATRMQHLEKDWQAWEKKDAFRVEALTQQYTQTSIAQHIERELERLPLVEETPLAFNKNGQHLPEFSYWQPPALARADLSERDLSHRYLGQADLREAQLRGASFFMSDLSGACLVGANLTDADLTGANLSYADLRNSVLTGANLQVADLSQAVLLGANLHGACNLTTQQVYAAIYDHTTQLDTDIDLTMPRLPRITHSMLKPVSTEQAPVVEPATPTNAVPETIGPAAEVEIGALDAAALPVPALETPAQETPALPILEAQTVAAFTETPGSNAAGITEITGAAEIGATSEEAENIEISTTSEAREVIAEIPALAAPEEVEASISEETVVPTAETREALALSEPDTDNDTALIFEPLEAFADTDTAEVTDTMPVPLALLELAGDEPISEYAATTEAADVPLLMPLVFPRSLEAVEEDDVIVLPACKEQSTEEVSPSPARESQPAVDAPEPDFPSSPALDDSSGDKAAILKVRKNKRSAPPIDITTQKGKYNGNTRKRARAR